MRISCACVRNGSTRASGGGTMRTPLTLAPWGSREEGVVRGPSRLGLEVVEVKKGWSGEGGSGGEEGLG